MTTDTAAAMRDIPVDRITETVAQLCEESTHFLPEDVVRGLERARENEKSELAKQVLVEILDNADLSRREMIPLCQDTGTTVVFVELGQDAHVVGGSLVDAINRGVGQGYTEGFLRASMVDHPFSSRANTKDNTPAVIHMDVVPGDSLKIKVMPKGGGCENMSRFNIFLPSEGKEAITNFVLRTIEYAMYLAKKAVTRNVDKPSPDPETAAFERELLDAVNALGVGAQAVGGTVTALAVNVETYPTHITSLPVGVNLQCHSARIKEAEL
jgi:fumarate hydratase subunit alpha